MKRHLERWTIEDLFKSRDLIQFPMYQREPNIWNEKKKKLLIDSILNDIDIPTIYLYKQDDGSYDCIDGRQRIETIFAFFNNELDISNDDTEVYWDNLEDSKKNIFESYELSVAILEDTDDDYLRKLFLRLQLGLPLNSGEKLHAMTGEMRDLVFTLAKQHPFFRMISIPSRRFSMEQLCAQIMINSFYMQLHDTFHSARFEDLEEFFETYDNLNKYQKQIKHTEKILDIIYRNFGDNLKEIKNRSLALSVFIFVYKMEENDKLGYITKFVEFFTIFSKRLREESAKGFDYDNRDLVDFQKYVTQASGEAYQIDNRNKGLENFFEYYRKSGKIFGDN